MATHEHYNADLLRWCLELNDRYADTPAPAPLCAVPVAAEGDGPLVRPECLHGPFDRHVMVMAELGRWLTTPLLNAVERLRPSKLLR